MFMQGSVGDARAPLQGPKDPASYSLNFLWLDKNVAVSVDQVFSKVRRRVFILHEDSTFLCLSTVAWKVGNGKHLYEKLCAEPRGQGCNPHPC